MVTYYYNWKKSRLISQIEIQQNSTKNSNGYDFDQSERNNDENADNAEIFEKPKTIEEVEQEVLAEVIAEAGKEEEIKAEKEVRHENEL